MQNHYPVMPPRGDRAAMQVPASPDAICLIWAVCCDAPRGAGGTRCLGAFEYKTNLVWTKDRVGLGAWARGTRMSCSSSAPAAPFKPPEPNHSVSSVIVAPTPQWSTPPNPTLSTR